jgi:hypothetical protein
LNIGSSNKVFFSICSPITKHLDWFRWAEVDPNRGQCHLGQPFAPGSFGWLLMAGAGLF